MGCVSTKTQRNVVISNPFKFVHLYQLKTQTYGNKTIFIEKSFLNGLIPFNEDKYFEIDSIYQMDKNLRWKFEFRENVLNDEFSNSSFGSMDYDSVHSEEKQINIDKHENQINIEELIQYLQERKNNRKK